MCLEARNMMGKPGSLFSTEGHHMWPLHVSTLLLPPGRQMVPYYRQTVLVCVYIYTQDHASTLHIPSCTSYSFFFPLILDCITNKKRTSGNNWKTYNV